MARRYLDMQGTSAPAVSDSGESRTYYDASAGLQKQSINGGAYRSLPFVLSGTAVYDPASLADGVGATTTVTVTGAALGDVADASFSLDLQGIGMTAYVSAADTVSIRLQNESGGTLDLASGTLKAVVFKF